MTVIANVMRRIMSEEKFRVFSINRLFTRARQSRRGRKYKSHDWLFEGTWPECMEFIAIRAEKLGNQIFDDIQIRTLRGGKREWTIKDLPLLNKRNGKMLSETNSISAQLDGVLVAGNSQGPDSKIGQIGDVMQKAQNVENANKAN